MTITALDPKTALVVVDLQKGIVSLPTVHPGAEVVLRARSLADAFRRHGLPVVLVRVGGAPSGRTERPSNVANLPPGWDEFVPEMNPRPEDHVVTKFTWGAFTNTDLEAHLRSLGVTQVVIAGIATSAGVESTARHAARTWVQRHARHRRHDRYKRRGSHQQRRTNFSKTRRNRHGAGDRHSPRKGEPVTAFAGFTLSTRIAWRSSSNLRHRTG